MPNHRRPRRPKILARAAARVVARHRAEPPAPSVPVEQLAESSTQVTAALAALAVLDADPAASAVCAWRIEKDDAGQLGALVSGQLSVHGPDPEEASLALLTALADKYRGTIREGSTVSAAGTVEVSARFQLGGVSVEIWNRLMPLVCSRCGAPGTWTVRFTSRVCPGCVEAIDRKDALETKATQEMGGVTSSDASGPVGLSEEGQRAAYVATWLPTLRPLVVEARGTWVPERVMSVLKSRCPSVDVTRDQAVSLLSVLASEGTLVRDDREGPGALRWAAPWASLPPVPEVREFDTDGPGVIFDHECDAVLVDGQLTHCGCPGCQARVDQEREACEVPQ